MAVRDIVQAAAGVGGGANPYIEDVFSTYLYTGNGSTQTITNGIDLAGEGGLVWLKQRVTDPALGNGNNLVFDTERGATNNLVTNSSAAQTTIATQLTAFNSDGFSVSSQAGVNSSGITYASWTFRKAPKFFDVVTYTGDGNFSTDRQISHNLGATPGFIIIKATSTTGNWWVWHRSVPDDNSVFASVGVLNLTSDFGGYQGYAINSKQTDSFFTLRTSSSGKTNDSGVTYVAYLFAHDAGGFGDDGEQNVISCGSYVGNGSTTGTIVNLGWEPQWLMIKAASATGDWNMLNIHTGMVVEDSDAELRANNADAETYGALLNLLSNGFQIVTSVDAGYNTSGETYIYVAIRRGLMRTPTIGSNVFTITQYTGTGSSRTVTEPVNAYLYDSLLQKGVSGSLGSYGATGWQVNKLRRMTTYTSSSRGYMIAGQSASTGGITRYFEGGFDIASSSLNSSGVVYINYWLKRAHKFFDQLVYIGTGANRTIAHNLGQTPELILIKAYTSSDWAVYANEDNTDYLVLNTNAASADDSTYWNDTSPTSTQFTLGTNIYVNEVSTVFGASLFATVPNVSKVGSYTGTGTTLAIDCGFSTGARFVMIKRTDSTGDWYVWDSVRGIVSGDDPYTLFDTTSVQVTNTDYIDPSSAGFEITSTAPADINASGGNFIFLAIA